MGMPETAVYKNDGIVARKNEIWLPRIPLVADPVAETCLEKSRPDLLFGAGIPGSDVRHVFMAVFGGKGVHS